MQQQPHPSTRKQLYAISLNDHSAPSFCSFSKRYIGDLDELQIFIDRLEQTGSYLQTVEAFRAYTNGDHEVKHPVAHSYTKLLTPVELINENCHTYFDLEVIDFMNLPSADDKRDALAALCVWQPIEPVKLIIRKEATSLADN